MKILPSELHKYFKNNVEYKKGDGFIIANILKENNIDINERMICSDIMRVSGLYSIKRYFDEGFTHSALKSFNGTLFETLVMFYLDQNEKTWKNPDFIFNILIELKEYGMDINALKTYTDDKPEEVLWITLLSRDINVVKTFINLGVDLNIKCDLDEGILTPLTYSKIYPLENIDLLLKSGVNPYFPCESSVEMEPRPYNVWTMLYRDYTSKFMPLREQEKTHITKIFEILSLYVKNYDEIFEIPFEKSISMKEMYKNICPYVLANIENKEINESFINPIVNHNKMRL